MRLRRKPRRERDDDLLQRLEQIKQAITQLANKPRPTAPTKELDEIADALRDLKPRDDQTPARALLQSKIANGIQVGAFIAAGVAAYFAYQAFDQSRLALEVSERAWISADAPVVFDIPTRPGDSLTAHLTIRNVGNSRAVDLRVHSALASAPVDPAEPERVWGTFDLPERWTYGDPIVSKFGIYAPQQGRHDASVTVLLRDQTTEAHPSQPNFPEEHLRDFHEGRRMAILFSRQSTLTCLRRRA
jgi:hypothetical protein